MIPICQNVGGRNGIPLFTKKSFFILISDNVYTNYPVYINSF